MSQNWDFDLSQEEEEDSPQYLDKENSENRESNQNELNTAPIDVIESDLYQDKVMFNPRIQSGDIRAFIDEYLDTGDFHRGHVSKMIIGKKDPSGKGEASKVKDLLADIIEDEELSEQRVRAARVSGLSEKIEEPSVPQYSDVEHFINDLTEVIQTDGFSRFATSTQEYVKREDEIEAVANFLEKYGEREEILGVPHFKYTFDDDLDLSDYTPGERSEVDTERKFIEEVVQIGYNYGHGLIGKESSDTKNRPWFEITMRASNVEEYSAN